MLALRSASQRESETELQIRGVLGYKSWMGRVHHDVSIGRLKDEAFRVWLFNASWLLCKKGAVLLGVKGVQRDRRRRVLAWICAR